MDEKQSAILGNLLYRNFDESDWVEIFKLCGEGNFLKRSELIKSVHWHNSDEKANCIYAIEYLIENCKDDFFEQLKERSYLMKEIQKKIPEIIDEINGVSINNSQAAEELQKRTENKLVPNHISDKLESMEDLIIQIKNIMFDVSTGKASIETKNPEYHKIYNDLDKKYKKNGLVNPNTFSDLWEFQNYWKMNLKSYAERRDYVIKLYKQKEVNLMKVEGNIKVNNKSSKVFIVHGSDELAKEKVARFLDKIDLDPVILHEKSNNGRTLIEKFEHQSNEVDYAVIIMTPDDEGKAKSELDLKDRARQNVILELGFFMGKLGRKKCLCII